MDAFASKRISLKQMNAPKLFFYPTQVTLVDTLKNLSRSVTVPDLNAMDSVSGEMEWNPYVMLCDLVETAKITDEDDYHKCHPWEVIGDVDFGECVVSNVDGVSMALLLPLDDNDKEHETEVVLNTMLQSYTELHPRRKHSLPSAPLPVESFEPFIIDEDVADYVIEDIEPNCDSMDTIQLQPPMQFPNYQEFSAELKDNRLSLPPRTFPKQAEFSARRAVDSFMNLRQVQRQANQPRSLFSSSKPSQFQSPPSPPVRQKFNSPYNLESLQWNKPNVKHTYIVGSRVIQNPQILEILEQMNVDIIERDYGEMSGTMANRDLPLDFDFIIDERTCVIFCPAIFIFQQLQRSNYDGSFEYTSLPDLIVQNLAPQMIQSLSEWFLLTQSLLQEVSVNANIVWSQNLTETIRIVRLLEVW
ncbi:hypothetical protein BDR26DRAFT_127503 [Obelidium mucronatum]|nr:hypothetical protein BDR26DRAFT_127503 [Obelidium mucronatum]